MGLGGEAEVINGLLPQKRVINEQVVVGLMRCRNRSRGAGTIKRENALAVGGAGEQLGGMCLGEETALSEV